MTPRDGEENQEINDILVTEERIRNENGPMEPIESEISVHLETEITDEECIIADVLKALMIRNEREYPPFKKLDLSTL